MGAKDGAEQTREDMWTDKVTTQHISIAFLPDFPVLPQHLTCMIMTLCKIGGGGGLE